MVGGVYSEILPVVDNFFAPGSVDRIDGGTVDPTALGGTL
jgi:hypothetical protein